MNALEWNSRRPFFGPHVADLVEHLVEDDRLHEKPRDQRAIERAVDADLVDPRPSSSPILIELRRRGWRCAAPT